MTQIAQEGDFDAIGAIYRRNHPNDAGQLTAGIQATTETFVIRDQADRVLGFAMVIAVRRGETAPYGMVDLMEITQDCPYMTVPALESSLAAACFKWLRELGVTMIHHGALNRGAYIAGMMAAQDQTSDGPSAPSGGPVSVELPKQIFT